MDVIALLERSYFGNTIFQWGLALVVALLAFAVIRVAMAVLLRRLRKLAQRTRTEYDDLAVDLLDSTKFLVLLALSLYVGSMMLVLTEGIEQVLDSAIVIVLIVQAAIWGNHVITFVLKRIVEQRLAEDAATATTMTGLGFVLRVGYFSLIVMVALGTLGWDVTALVTGLGIGGIAVALAVQNILGDLFASLSIVLDKPFVIGDFVTVGEFRGTVEHIGLKTTRVRSLTGEQLVFANSDLLNSRLRNFKRMSERRGTMTLGVTYDTALETLRAAPLIIREIIEEQELARFDRAHFSSFGDFSLNLEIVFWVTSPDYAHYMDTLQSINFEILQRFRERGIEFAFPTQTIHVEEAEAEPAEASA